MKLPAVMCMEGGYTIEAVGIDMVNLLEGFKTRSDIFGVEKMPLPRLGTSPSSSKKVSFSKAEDLAYVTCLDSYFYARFAYSPTPTA